MRVSGMFELIRWMHANGRSVEPLLQASGLAPFDVSDPDNVMPLLPASQFVLLVQEREGADIGAKIVSPETVSRIGGSGRILMAGPTIGEGLLKLAIKFSHQATHAHMTVTPVDGQVEVRHFYSVPLSDSFLHFAQQFNAAVLHTWIASIADARHLIERIEMVPHPDHGLDHLTPHFGNIVAASPNRNLRIRFRRDIFSWRTSQDSAAIDDIPPKRWISLRNGGSFAYSLGLIVRELLRDGEPTITAVARICGLSPRSLQRRLASEGETFSGLLDEVRRDVMLELLGSGGLSVREAGQTAGYTAPASITRAVRRWTGAPPRRIKGNSGT